MSERVREFHVKGDIKEGSFWWRFVPTKGDFSLVHKAEYDRLAEINKVLVEELQTTLDRYEDMNGGFFDSESKRIREVLDKAKEMGK